MKKSFSFLILLSLLCLLLLSGCTQHQTTQVICVLDREFRIGGNSEYKNVCYTVSNKKDNQRLSVKYSYLQTTDNRTAFFNFSFYEMDGMTAKDGGFVWEYYSDNRDASFVITDDLGNTIDFPNGDSYI